MKMDVNPKETCEMLLGVLLDVEDNADDNQALAALKKEMETEGLSTQENAPPRDDVMLDALLD